MAWQGCTFNVARHGLCSWHRLYIAGKGFIVGEGFIAGKGFIAVGVGIFAGVRILTCTPGEILHTR